MNDPTLNPSSEQELEIRITAVVLGEASDFERDQIDRLIEQRPELAAMKARIESMHQMLHDVGEEPWSAEALDDWKLPVKQRNALLHVLAGEGERRQLDEPPQDMPTTLLISRFTKIAGLVCAACLLVVLGLSRLVPSVRTASQVSLMQDDDGLAAGTSREYQQSVDEPSIEPEVASGPGGNSPIGGSGPVGSSRGGMSGMGGGMDGMGVGGELDIEYEGIMGGSMMGFSAAQPADEAATRFSRSTALPAIVNAPAATEESVLFRTRMDAVPPNEQRDSDKSIRKSMDTPSYFYRDNQQLPLSPAEPQEESKFLDFQVTKDRADVALGRTSELATSLKRDEFNGRSLSIDGVPLQMQQQAALDAAKPATGESELKERSFNFSAPSSWESLSLRRRGAAMSTPEPSAADDATPIPRKESLGIALGNQLTDGVNILYDLEQAPRDQQESESLLEALRAPQPELPQQGEKAEKKFDQSLRAAGRSKQNQARPDFVPESSTSVEPFSTFSLHVSDVSFKLAAAALAQGQWPEPSTVRMEEFVNAMDYGDPLPSQHERVACQIEQSIDPFVQQRNLLRVSLRTAAAGRAATTPLRLTLLLDNSGSMERMDRQQTVRRAFETLTQQLQPSDQITLIRFARTPRLLADRVSGDGMKGLVQLIENLPSDGGTNIEAALQLAWEKAREQWTEGAQNRIILLTDGAVNLGDADPEQLSNMVSNIRDTGIAFDAAGISANGLNDEVLEALTRKGDGRYYLLDSAESADDGFARQIAGALRPSAMNVKVQVEFNPERVGRYRLLGFEKHLLNEEDFRNDQVDAAEMAAAEAGVAVYQFEPLPDGEGDVGSVSVRFRDMSSGQMIERRWPILHQSNPPRANQAPASMRLATAASMFAAKLRGGPLGASVDLKALSELLASLPPQNRVAPRVQQLEQMIQQARQISGQ